MIGNVEALQAAKYNLEKHYAVVGLASDLETSLGGHGDVPAAILLGRRVHLQPPAQGRTRAGVSPQRGDRRRRRQRLRGGPGRIRLGGGPNLARVDHFERGARDLEREHVTGDRLLQLRQAKAPCTTQGLRCCILIHTYKCRIYYVTYCFKQA